MSDRIGTILKNPICKVQLENQELLVFHMASRVREILDLKTEGY